MNNWKLAYKEKKFSIDTEKPSLVVQTIANRLENGSKVLDLGCGEGRNSIFLAKRGCCIDAIDVADLDILENQPKNVREKINFTEGTVIKDYAKNSYDLVIATRLFQYLSPKEVEILIRSIHSALKEKGILVANYTESGGVFKEDINVNKYSHKIDFVRRRLEESGFKNMHIQQGDNTSKYVPYSRAIRSFDIIAEKF